MLEDVVRHIADHGPVASGDVGERRGAAAQRLVGLASVEDRARVSLAVRPARGHAARRLRQGLRSGRAGVSRAVDAPPRSRRSTGPATPRSTAWASPRRERSPRSGASSAPRRPKRWVATALKRGEVEPVDVECADGTLRRHVARPGLAEAADGVARAAEPAPRPLAVRSDAPRPQPRGAALRLPLSHRGLRAGSAPQVWLLRISGPGGRSADRAY